MAKAKKVKKPNAGHKDFDNILKGYLIQGIMPMIKRKTGLDVVNITELPTDLSRTQSRRIDALLLVELSTGYKFILHIEIQSKNDSQMDDRELFYYAIIYHKYRLPVQQFVLYLGKEKMKMPMGIQHQDLQHRYNIISMNEIPVAELINSDNPQEIILAVLAKYDVKDASDVVTQIITNLFLLERDEEILKKYLAELEILSNLRKLQPIIINKILKAMPVTYNMETDIRYNQGIEKGIREGVEKGIREGMKKGVEKGVLEHARTSIIKLLRNGKLSDVEIAEINDVPLSYVLELKKEIELGTKK